MDIKRAEQFEWVFLAALIVQLLYLEKCGCISRIWPGF